MCWPSVASRWGERAVRIHAEEQGTTESDFVTLQVLQLIAAQSTKVLFSVIGITFTMAAIYYGPNNGPQVMAWIALVE
jgi:hypothetical protein